MKGCQCDGSKCRLTADDRRHGTANGYTNMGCRCETCRRAWNTYFKPYLANYRGRLAARGLTARGTPRKQRQGPSASIRIGLSSLALVDGYAVELGLSRRAAADRLLEMAAEVKP